MARIPYGPDQVTQRMAVGGKERADGEEETEGVNVTLVLECMAFA